MKGQTGWKPIPLSLKILAIIFILWAAMSLMRLSSVYATGLPVFGIIIPGLATILLVLALDVIGPIAFLYALAKRLHWGPTVAYVYNGLFILNSLIALIVLRNQFGVMQIVSPAIISIIFVLLIWRKRDYFSR